MDISLRSLDNGLSYLKLCIGPSGNLDDHVEDCLLLIGIERDVVEWRDGHAILLNIASIVEGVLGSNLAGGEFRALAVRHCGGLTL